jgi:hypothetical protein
VKYGVVTWLTAPAAPFDVTARAELLHAKTPETPAALVQEEGLQMAIEISRPESSGRRVVAEGSPAENSPERPDLR